MRNYAFIWIVLAAICCVIWWIVLVWIGWMALLIIPAVGVIVHYLTREK